MGGKIFAMIGFAAITAGCRVEQHPSAREIAISWTVLENQLDGKNRFSSELTLKNQGQAPLGKGWDLYFNFGRRILPDSLPPEVQLTPINGDFYKLSPTQAFRPLPPGKRLTLRFDSLYWAIAESDAPSGFYFVFDEEGEPSQPEPVAQLRVQPFHRRLQTDRVAGDQVEVPTPESRYRQNLQLTLLPARKVRRIVPTPSDLKRGPATVTLDSSFQVHFGRGLEFESKYLVDALERLLGVRLARVESSRSAANTIVLRVGSVQVDARRVGSTEEAYRLSIDSVKGIQIVGTGAAGVLYGIQSLRAWMPVGASRRIQKEIRLDEVNVVDRPRFSYRGMHLDVARNFQSKETVEKLLDLMAFYKLNRFHFHLTDDEGWRLPVVKLPELTEVGGRRGHTLDEKNYLVPSLGSGPDPAASFGSGFYSRQDFVEILRYARDRHIRVVPEIDVPGHARAAIKSMEARYARLVEQGRKQEGQEYLLNDLQDRSEYQSVQGWRDGVANVCLESTYRFINTVVEEVIGLYKEADAPLTMIHTGGDEVPRGVWQKSPACRRFLDRTKAHGVSGVEELPDYFLRRLTEILSGHGLSVGGWEEVALRRQGDGSESEQTPSPLFVGSDFRVYVWNSIGGSGGEANAYKLANAGYKVVLCNASNLYLDQAYCKDPKEPGLYWAGFIDTRKPFEFLPLDLYRSARTDLMGHPIDPAKASTNRVRLDRAARSNILGIQGQLWSENAKGAEVMEYLVFPKLTALAERAWSRRPRWAGVSNRQHREEGLSEDWNQFANSLGRRELPRLDTLAGGVHYRIPLPGAVVESGVLRANVAFPGLSIRYTSDGSQPTAASTLYTGPVKVTGAVKLRTFNTLGRGSRTSVVEGPG
ncbi:MAG: family 20 glycosylhydrolase [Acidobacteriota bacterium]